MPSIGVSTPRRDSEPKVRGATRFAADIPVNGLLHARLLLAHDAHALIKSIDTSAARELPGVVAVLTADDLPIVAKGTGRSKNPLAREEIMYAGQPIAIAVAETEALAADAIELIDVELEHVEAVTDVEGAVLPGAARARLHVPDQGDDGDLGDAHASVAAAGVGDEEELSENVLGTARLVNGDVDAAFAASAAVVRGRFHTPWVHQGYLETQTATAWFDVDDELVVSTSTQAPFMTRDEVASLFGLPVDRVRVRCAPLGGGFGGKMMIPEPLVVSAVLATRRPVRLAMTRSEDFAAANPAGAEVLEVEVGADREGNLTGIRTRIWCDRGSTDSMGVESIAAMLSAGPYRWQAHHLTCYGVSDQSRDVRRVPRADRAAGGVRRRVDDRRAGGAARDRPAGAAAAQRARSRRQDRGRPGDEGVRRARVPRAPRWRTLSGAGAGRCRRTRESASRSAGGRAGTSRRPPHAGSTPTGTSRSSPACPT